VSKSALVVIDLQKAVVAPCWDPAPVVTRTAALVKRARQAETPVVWVQHESPGMPFGSDGWQLADELVPLDGEPRVYKRFRDSFADTRLREVLDDLGAARLVIAGAETDNCVRATVHRAIAEGYDVTVVSDCHTAQSNSFGDVSWTGEQVIAHDNRLWSRYSAPGVSVGTATGATVDL
jgi:nicotinamidase-related amidase